MPSVPPLEKLNTGTLNMPLDVTSCWLTVQSRRFLRRGLLPTEIEWRGLQVRVGSIPGGSSQGQIIDCPFSVSLPKIYGSLLVIEHTVPGDKKKRRE